MAVGAERLGVGTFQREVRVLRVIELRFFPFFNVVALLTFHAKLLGVNITDGVAIITGS